MKQLRPCVDTYEHSFTSEKWRVKSLNWYWYSLQHTLENGWEETVASEMAWEAVSTNERG